MTANAIEPAGDDVADRNYARLVGNVAQQPRFRENDRSAFAATSIATGPEKFADVIGYGAQATEIRETLGQGDGIAVEGRVRPREGRDGFPASVQVVANEVELERKNAPRVELEGALTRDPEIREGPKMTRVALQRPGERLSAYIMDGDVCRNGTFKFPNAPKCSAAIRFADISAENARPR